jgi:hypothetical protein
LHAPYLPTNRLGVKRHAAASHEWLCGDHEPLSLV